MKIVYSATNSVMIIYLKMSRIEKFKVFVLLYIPYPYVCSLYTFVQLFPQKLMTLQTKDVSEVSKFTVEALQYRINPCLHETERQTVESLLYIPPFDPQETGLGNLWIGLGNGCLKVYDMDGKCFESSIKITDSKHGKSLRLVSQPHPH